MMLPNARLYTPVGADTNRRTPSVCEPRLCYVMLEEVLATEWGGCSASCDVNSLSVFVP